MSISESAPYSEFAPLRLGPITISPPVVLAPMAGVTNAPYRSLCRSYSQAGAAPSGPASAQPALYVSEMVTARALLERNERTMRMAAFGPDEPVRSIQLYGVDPMVMRDAVSLLVNEVGVEHIDLNFGCPAKKVTRLGGGAALPYKRRLLDAILRGAVSAAGDVPVTMKTRLGPDDDHLTYLDAGRIAADAGCVAIALHARTAEQLYSGSARWETITRLVEAVGDEIPVLGNGDLRSGPDALAMMRETGCAGVVVGRGCLGRPWLFGELAAAFAGRPAPPVPNLGEVLAVMKRHAQLLVEWFESETQGIKELRKHTSWYLKGFPVGPDVRRRLQLIERVADIESICSGLDPSTPFPPGAAELFRGHTQGPKAPTLPHGWLDDPDEDVTMSAEAGVFVSGG